MGDSFGAREKDIKFYLSFHQAKTGQLDKYVIDLFWTTPVCMAASVHSM
jgi:hypothetical protein